MARVHPGLWPRTRNGADSTVIDWFLLRIAARLRRPAIVASVAMNGGSRSWLIMSACNKPIVRPRSSVSAIASAIKAGEGGAVGELPEWSQSVNSLALTIDDS